MEVLDPIPFAFHVYVGNYLAGLGARRELDRRVALHTNRSVAWLDRPQNRTAAARKRFGHKLDIGNRYRAVEPHRLKWPSTSGFSTQSELGIGGANGRNECLPHHVTHRWLVLGAPQQSVDICLNPPARSVEPIAASNSAAVLLLR